MMTLTEEMVIARKFQITTDQFNSGMRLVGVCDFWVGTNDDCTDFSFGKDYILDTGFSTFLSLPANHESTTKIIELEQIIKQEKPCKVKSGTSVSLADKYKGAFLKFVDGSKQTIRYGPFLSLLANLSM